MWLQVTENQTYTAAYTNRGGHFSHITGSLEVGYCWLCFSSSSVKADIILILLAFLCAVTGLPPLRTSATLGAGKRDSANRVYSPFTWKAKTFLGNTWNSFADV